MATAFAEILQSPSGVNGDFHRTAVAASELLCDPELRNKAASLIGTVALQSSIEITPVVEKAPEQPRMTLEKACRLAYEGDPVAREMVRTNVATDYGERSRKYRMVSRVSLMQTEDGQLMQGNQLLEHTNLNGIEFLQNQVMKDRAADETVNGVRNQYYHEQLWLDDAVVAVFSLVTRKLSEEQAEEQGFFLPTMSLSVQLLGKDKTGVYIETALVAGRDFETEAPFDEAAVKQLLKTNFGIDLDHLTADELLQQPILIDRSKVSSVVDLVSLYDEVAESLTGKSRYFGKTVTSETIVDYAGQLQRSEDELRLVQRKLDENVKKLINSSGTFKNPTDATRMLDLLNDELLKADIIQETSIDCRVLGREVAWTVQHARALVQQQNYDQQMMIYLQRQIREKGTSSSCPGNNKLVGSHDGLDGIGSIYSELYGETNIDKQDNEALEDCEFISEQCPKCGEKNVKTECRSGVYYGACGCSSK